MQNKINEEYLEQVTGGVNNSSQTGGQGMTLAQFYALYCNNCKNDVNGCANEIARKYTDGNLPATCPDYEFSGEYRNKG